MEVLDVVSKLSIVVGVLSYLHSRRALRLQHERSRREKATGAIAEFSRSMTPRSAAAKKLVRKLDTAQIDSLEEGREFVVKHEDRNLLLAALPDHITEANLQADADVRLSRNQSYLLRWEIVSKLNSCEVLAQYWLTDVADRRTIEQELDFLLGESPGDNILTQCRKLAEARRFPALHALIAELERRRAPNQTPTRLEDEPPPWKKALRRLANPDA
jgi:hypothetical protein